MTPPRGLPDGIERIIWTSSPVEGKRPRICVKYRFTCQGAGCAPTLVDRVQRVQAIVAKHEGCCQPAWRPLFQLKGEDAEQHLARLQPLFRFQMLPGEGSQPQPTGLSKRTCSSPQHSRPCKRARSANGCITQYFTPNSEAAKSDMAPCSPQQQKRQSSAKQLSAAVGTHPSSSKEAAKMPAEGRLLFAL